MKANRHFGIGDSSEAASEMFRAFMECKGYLSTKKRAVEFSSVSTLANRKSRCCDDTEDQLEAAQQDNPRKQDLAASGHSAEPR